MADKFTLDKCAKICKEYGVNYRFSKTKQNYALCWKNFIHVAKDQSNDFFISTVFHEIQHCLNYRNKKYFTYHKGRMTIKMARRWMLPAEIYTDKMAEKLALKHGFKRFIRSYRNDFVTKAFINRYIDRIAKRHE